MSYTDCLDRAITDTTPIKLIAKLNKAKEQYKAAMDGADNPQLQFETEVQKALADKAHRDLIE